MTDTDNQPYAVTPGAPLADEIRRMAHAQLDAAVQELRSLPLDDIEDSVHDARKRCKKVRALLRLVRPVIGESVYAAENAAYREAARLLGDLRDAQVMGQSLATVAEDADVPVAAVARAQRQLAHRAELLRPLVTDGGAMTAAAERLELAQRRIGSWPLTAEGSDLVAPGVRRVYAQGRRRRKAAADTPPSAQLDERLHDWRKREKDLWYHLRILEPVAPAAAELLPVADRLADALGLDHDLAVLRAVLVEHAEATPVGALLRTAVPDIGERTAIVTALDERRRSLQEECWQLGDRLYAPSPAEYVEALFASTPRDHAAESAGVGAPPAA